jgi:hypothetical protein
MSSVVLPVLLAAQALLPGDVARSHVETVAKSGHVYTVLQGGTIDGRMGRSPAGVYEGWTRGFESNRALRMENAGETDVLDPWVSNGRNTFRTVQEIVATAVKPGMSDREKALALYDQQIRHRWHWHGDNDELGDPVKVFNIYGHDTCGNDSICLAGLWKRAGLKVSPACAVGHCISQVWFDGRWNLMDGDQQGLYLLRDGRTVASESEIARDHDLVKRAHVLGILHPESRRAAEGQAALFVLEGGERGTRDSAARHTLAMTLRPGEALVWRWDRRDPLRLHGEASGHRAPHTVANGRWEYRPDFAKETWRKGTDRAENLRRAPDGVAAEDGKTATIEWTLKAPYVIVGGRLEAEGRAARFEISVDGTSWKPAGADLDPHFPPTGRAIYSWKLRCTLAGDACLRRLAILNDLQMAPLSLPEMVVGENRFTYTDATPGGRSVRLTHEWVERSTTRPPDAPASAVSPPDGGESDGTRIAFTWSPAKDPDGDRIADYHFQLSDRADFAYTISSTFNRLVSKVGGRAEERFELPRPGLLAPDLRYFWRVRAMDANSIWGPWGGPWSFTARGPGVPTDVRIDVDQATGSGLLRWSPNASGTRPVKYRVYASDEKGFSLSDGPDGTLGSRDAPNFIAETPATEFAVLSRAGGLNRAHYRVAAVDAAGRRSADSDFASAPRPFLFSTPIDARSGREIRGRVGTVRSLGDAKTRDASRPQTRFWETEQPRFALEEGPTWLRIDPSTGELSGTPPAPGRARVVVTAVLEVEERSIDPKALVWGQDKTLGTAVKTLGPARLELVVEVGP